VKAPDIGFWEAFKIAYTGRGVTPLMMASKALADTELRLLEMEMERERYNAECEMLGLRRNRLKRTISILSKDESEAD